MGVVERDNYLVDGNILRRLLVALDQLKVLEAKTRDPKRFERIDLRDLTPGARGGQVVVRDSQGEVVFDAIIGKRRANSAGGPARVYVRNPATTDLAGRGRPGPAHRSGRLVEPRNHQHPGRRPRGRA